MGGEAPKRAIAGGGPTGAGALAAETLSERVDHAVNWLLRTRPEMSASRPVTDVQRAVFAGLMGAVLLLFAAANRHGFEIALAAFTVPFASVSLVRIAALSHLLARRTPAAADGIAPPPLRSEALPFYSLLIPLYREATVIPALVAGLRGLDYPPARFEVLFVTEEDDGETRRALAAQGLDANMRVLEVPDGLPRTKPRALNFALTFARGDLVAVFDAEDVADPGQLRRAAAAFAAGGEDLACVQARLNIYNPGNNFFTRQFTLEYSALFDAILPALAWLRLPLPLGGTSNHFPRAALEAAGAWDPYNVTEDADLGIRLARLGKRTAMLDSVTWEEAPASLKAWFGQRTRWIKGWMQTYLVHMRAPILFLREVGAWRFFGFQVIFGGLILSALVHPLIYAAAAWQFSGGALWHSPEHGLAAVLWVLSLANLAVSYVAAMVLAAVAVAHRGGLKLMRSAVGVPVYWLAISAAAYWALFDLVRRPHHWSKTMHTGEGRESIGAVRSSL